MIPLLVYPIGLHTMNYTTRYTQMILRKIHPIDDTIERL